MVEGSGADSVVGIAAERLRLQSAVHFQLAPTASISSLLGEHFCELSSIDYAIIPVKVVLVFSKLNVASA